MAETSSDNLLSKYGSLVDILAKLSQSPLVLIHDNVNDTNASGFDHIFFQYFVQERMDKCGNSSCHPL